MKLSLCHFFILTAAAGILLFGACNRFPYEPKSGGGEPAVEAAEQEQETSGDDS